MNNATMPHENAPTQEEHFGGMSYHVVRSS